MFSREGHFTGRTFGRSRRRGSSTGQAALIEAGVEPSLSSVGVADGSVDSSVDFEGISVLGRDAVYIGKERKANESSFIDDWLNYCLSLQRTRGTRNHTVAALYIIQDEARY
jgi:hypothetical protein